MLRLLCSLTNKRTLSSSSTTTTFDCNLLMKTQVAQGAHLQALQTFSHMHRTSIPFDNFTFPIALKACTPSPSSSPLQQLHSLVLLLGFLPDVYISNALLFAYSNYGLMDSATQLFDEMPHRTTVTWNSIITGCARCGVAYKSVSYFSRMMFDSKEEPDSVTFCAVLNVHALVGADARAVHGYVVRQEPRGVWVVSSVPFVENALINMYVECSRLNYAENVFRMMPFQKRDVVTWTTMITGYMRYKGCELTLGLFRAMQREQRNVSLDPVALVAVMPAITSLHQGREMHCFALKRGYDCFNVFVAASLINMYAVYGHIEYAFKQFERVEKKNVVVWTAMITACAKHGCSEDSLRLFSEMQKQKGVTPNHLTFMGVLTACNHAGLVDEAKELLSSMTQEHRLIPDMYHYATMVDLLGRSGRVREALKFIEGMPVKATAAVWGSLLASCGLHQEVELGHEVAKIVVGMEPNNPVNFVFLSNMLAEGKKWSDACMVRESMEKYGLKKEPGLSSVDATK